MASAADGKVVVPDYYDSDDDSSGSDRGGFNVNPLNHGQSMPPGMEHTTFGDFTGRPAPPEEQAPQPLQTVPPGSTDDRLRESIFALFGPSGDNSLSSLTMLNMAARGPAMYATYNQSPFSLRNPVTFIYFSNNLIDYLKHRGGRKKQRRSVIKKRKSMSKKRKNGRKSNKKQRRR